MKEKNTSTYVIGDVHGCFYTLQKLIAKIPNDAEIIFVGDLCDKGNFSKEVIDFVIKNKYRCVKGNHEYLMQKYLYDAVVHQKHSPWSEDYRYGGIQTYTNYLDDHQTMQKHLDWIQTLPMYIEIDNYFITHGFALPFYEHRDNQEYHDTFLLNRYEHEMEVAPSDVINIFGHCVFEEVIKHQNFYAIDTGCAYGKKITAVELGSMYCIEEAMDNRDSAYIIEELKLSHLELSKHAHNLESFIYHIDFEFKNFDLVSTEVGLYIVQNYGKEGINEIQKMLDKKQLFIKQAKVILRKAS